MMGCVTEEGEGGTSGGRKVRKQFSVHCDGRENLRVADTPKTTPKSSRFENMTYFIFNNLVYIHRNVLRIIVKLDLFIKEVFVIMYYI